MKKLLALLTILLCMSMSVSAIDIDLIKGDPNPDPIPPEDRSAIGSVTASLESQVLIVQFSELTSSQVVITNALTNSTVWSNNYIPSYCVQADLTSLPAGSYTLYIYAYGIWWHGTFAIE